MDCTLQRLLPKLETSCGLPTTDKAPPTYTSTNSHQTRSLRSYHDIWWSWTTESCPVPIQAWPSLKYKLEIITNSYSLIGYCLYLNKRYKNLQKYPAV